MVMIGSAIIGAVSAIAASDAANGSYSTFLPLIMNAIGAMAEVPQGAVMSFNLPSCPSGWTEVTNAQGKAIVGLPSGGTLSGTVGSGLGDLEDRTHSHNVDPPNSATTMTGSHDHTVDIPLFSSGASYHKHQWAVYYGGTNEWYAWDRNGDFFKIMNWGDGMDSAGSGYFPLAEPDTEWYDVEYYTQSFFHAHADVDIPNFDTGVVGDHNHTVDILQHNTTNVGTHIHTVDIPNTTSTTASTSDVMPYIQFLVCEKD